MYPHGECGCGGEAPDMENPEECGFECAEIIPSQCVIFNGDSLTCGGETTPLFQNGQNLNQILASMGNAICNGFGGATSATFEINPATAIVGPLAVNLTEAPGSTPQAMIYDIEFVIPPGTPGTNGLSAYQEWLNLGNTGSEQDFIDSLRGPQGEPGICDCDILSPHFEGSSNLNTSANHIHFLTDDPNYPGNGTDWFIRTGDENSKFENVKSTDIKMIYGADMQFILRPKEGNFKIIENDIEVRVVKRDSLGNFLSVYTIIDFTKIESENLFTEWSRYYANQSVMRYDILHPGDYLSVEYRAPINTRNDVIKTSFTGFEIEML